MSAPLDAFRPGEVGFGADLPAEQGSGWHAYAVIVAALLILTAAVLGSLWWLDRVAAPPALRPTIQPRASWLDGPVRAERELATLEQPERGRP